MRGELLRAALEASLSAAVMTLAVLVLRLRFQDRTPRRAFCLLWDMVTVRLLIPGALPSPVSVRRWLPALGARLEAASKPVTLGVAVQSGEAWQTVYVEGDIFQLVPAEDAAASAATGWSGLVTGLWLGAALLLAAGFLWSHLRSRKVYAASLPLRDDFVSDWLAEHPLLRPVQARCSDRITAPLTYGILYPVILLPCGMDWGDDLPWVLAHEHEHIRRFDALRKLFLAAALCLHWYNPLVWAMYALANRDMELVCDEAALRGGADREQYALALLRMEEQRGQWSPSGSHFSGHALEERIRAIMKRKQISITALVALLVVMSVTTTVFASAAPAEKTEPDTSSLIAAIREKKAVDEAALREIWGRVKVFPADGEETELKLFSLDGSKELTAFNGDRVVRFYLDPSATIDNEGPVTYVYRKAPTLVPAEDSEKQGLGFDTCTPLQGKISAPFGQGSHSFHAGVDIAAEKGTDIAAFAAGTVSGTGFSAEHGNYVILTHPEGYSTFYAHCLSGVVAEGEIVEVGQIIAQVGATGMATGPVLHFELRSGESCLDPTPYLGLGA